MSTAIIPYTQRMTPMEFIASEIKRGLENSTREQLELAQNIGLTGQATIKKMADALKSHSLQMRYCNGSETFIILNSAGISKRIIENIFLKNSYEGWEPEVLDRVDSLGNRQVQLRSIPELQFIRQAPTLCPVSNQPLIFDVRLNGDRVGRVNLNLPITQTTKN